MSMIGEYARVTPNELKRALSDPGWAYDFVQELLEEQEEADQPTGQARCLDTDKAWHAIGFLLRRVGFPVDIVHGEQPIPGADDWGYGPPCYLTPERVRIAAESLPSIPFEALVQGVTPEQLSQADVYPQIWSDQSALDYVRHHYESLSPFFVAAAAEGDAVLVWLD
jgi:hypothetical protein